GGVPLSPGTPFTGSACIAAWRRASLLGSARKSSPSVGGRAVGSGMALAVAGRPEFVVGIPLATTMLAVGGLGAPPFLPRCPPINFWNSAVHPGGVFLISSLF